MINFRNRCQRLLHLNLGYNKISHVESGDFEWAEDLEILLLRNNILTKLKAETFKGAGASPMILVAKLYYLKYILYIMESQFLSSVDKAVQ